MSEVSTAVPRRLRGSNHYRVFHLIKSLGRGGAEMLLTEGLRFADRDRFTYGYGYFLPCKSAMVASLESQNADVICFEARTTVSVLLSARRLARHLVNWNADVLHCHMPVAGIVGRIAARIAGIPVVYTEHNKMERFHPVTRRLNLMTWGWQQRVIAVSGDVAASITSHTRHDVRVDIVLNGVNVDQFQTNFADREEMRRRLGIPSSAPVVGTVAVFRVQKRLDEWLEAAGLIRTRSPDVHFIIVGDGPLHEAIVARAAELGLSDVVHFTGLQESVRPYLAAMDVYMMSSIFEGLPVALLEAMAMERAVVCTSVGGIPEAVTHGHDGFLVEASNPSLLANAAAEVLESPETLRRCGEQARRTVTERFSMRRMSAHLEGIYHEVVMEYRGSPARHS